MPLISVIVPVYNAERYLSECIESILSQTFPDFELILINDGSTDKSPIICEQYKAQSTRIKVFHQPNAGVSAARNKGIDNAQGKYIVFVDSDDIVEPHYLQSFISRPDIPSNTLVIQGVKVIDRFGVVRRITKSDYEIADLASDIIHFGFLFAGPPYAKLLEKDILDKNNIRFDEKMNTNEDHLFHLRYLQYTHSVISVPKVGYSYVNRGGESLSTCSYAFEELFYGLTKLTPLTENIIDLFGIDREIIIEKLFFTPNTRFKLAILSLYKKPVKRSARERKRKLKRLVENYGEYYFRYYTPRNIGEKFMKDLLHTQSFLIIDFIFSFVLFIKFSILETILKKTQ